MQEREGNAAGTSTRSGPDDEPDQRPKREKAPGGSEDIQFGQYVIVTARWILVAAGLVLALWVTENAESQRTLQQVQVSFVVLAILAFWNFYLNLQLLRKRPAAEIVAYGASAADLAVISVLIWVQGGFASQVYIFYFPALLAISVAFSREATAAYTAGAVVAYTLIALPTVVSSSDQQTLMTRIVIFAAIAFCGHMYFRIEHDRRRDAARAMEQMTAGLGQR